MPKKKQRKPRGKVRQQIRLAVEDHTLWDEDFLMIDDTEYYPEIKDKTEKQDLSRKKRKVRQPTHRDFELWVEQIS